MIGEQLRSREREGKGRMTGRGNRTEGCSDAVKRRCDSRPEYGGQKVSGAILGYW